MNKPLFSVIIPVYNAEQTLSAAVGSLIAQSFENWEAIIIDDCSTDSSLDVATMLEKQDPRIQVLSLQKNTGTPHIPREKGMENAIGEYMVFLDSDDEIASDYLEKMANCAQDNNVDIVLPVMVLKQDANDSIEEATIPNRSFIGKEFAGEEACRLTIPTYTIGCGGMAFRKLLYDYVKIENRCEGIYTDELSERILLYHARRVVQSSAEYYYYQNDTSVTHKRSVRYYQYLWRDKYLLDFCKEHFDRHIQAEMAKSMLSHFLVLYKDYIKHRSEFSMADKHVIKDIFSNSYAILQQRYEDFSKKGHLYMLNEKMCYALCYISSLLK